MKRLAHSKMSLTIASIIAAATMCAIIATGATQNNANRPDHSGFTDCQPCHADTYNMWETSKHSKTLTCMTCHKPGSDTHPKQLAADPEKLCDSCHTQRAVLNGRGASGIEDTRSFHSGVACTSCHMSESNHYMKVMRPDDANIPEDRLDTCTRCHKDNNRQARAKQLPDWQEFYKEAMDPVEADMREIDTALEQKPDLLNAELKDKLSSIRANLAIVQQDGSRGAHNLDFALEIASHAKLGLKEVKTAVAASAK